MQEIIFTVPINDAEVSVLNLCRVNELDIVYLYNNYIIDCLNPDAKTPPLKVGGLNDLQLRQLHLIILKIGGFAALSKVVEVQRLDHTSLKNRLTCLGVYDSTRSISQK